MGSLESKAGITSGTPVKGLGWAIKGLSPAFQTVNTLANQLIRRNSGRLGKLWTFLKEAISYSTQAIIVLATLTAAFSLALGPAGPG